MKEKLLKLKNKADKVTYYLWESDSTFIVSYIAIVALICSVANLFGYDWDGFLCISLGLLTGKALRYRLRIRRTQR